MCVCVESGSECFTVLTVASNHMLTHCNYVAAVSGTVTNKHGAVRSSHVGMGDRDDSRRKTRAGPRLQTSKEDGKASKERVHKERVPKGSN